MLLQWCCRPAPLFLSQATTPFLLSFLRELAELDPEASQVHEARVISCTEDVPSRCFSDWYSCFTAGDVGMESAAPQPTATIVKVAAGVNAFLRNLGDALAQGSEEQAKQMLANLQVSERGRGGVRGGPGEEWEGRTEWRTEHGGQEKRAPASWLALRDDGTPPCQSGAPNRRR